MSLKAKAIKSFNWTVLEMIFSQGSVFLTGIILARILSPEDFGIVGLMTVFIAVSNSIVEGGFSSALIRKKDASDEDYTTVFYTNLVVGIFLYCLLFISSKNIAIFFDIPILENVLKYSGIILIINAISIIQITILTKLLDFKTQSIISICAALISGIVAIILAYQNFGIWSLVTLSILKPFLNSVLLWLQNKWRPSLSFSKSSFAELFDYGYKLLIANIINTVYKNIYYILIGKFFSPISLGYYTRAEQFQAPVANNITSTIRRISFPILSTLQDDSIKLRASFIKFLRFTIFLNFTVMITIAAVAKPIIIILIGEKWYTSIYYLQLLCIPGMLYPLQIVHLNLLLVKGHSNINLRLEIIKKIVLLPLIIGTALISIEAMLYGLILFSVIEYFINSHYTKSLINYSLKDQVKDILPFLSTAIIIFSIMFSLTFFDLTVQQMLIFQLIAGGISFLITNEIFRLNEYLEIKIRIVKVYKKIIANNKTFH